MAGIAPIPPAPHDDRVTATEPIGAAGAATFAISIEGETTVSYGWLANVLPSTSGLEQRQSLMSKPRQRYEFTALLDETQQRKVLAQLARYGAAGSLFYVGLSFESLPVKSSTSSTIEMHSLATCDWSQEGQRILVVSPAGVQAETWIASIAGTTLTVDDDVSAVAVDGATVMPLMGVRLDPAQALPRYQRKLARWNLVALAERFRFGAAGEPGVGASITTYDSMPVWDRGVAIDGTREESLRTGVAMLDAGTAIGAMQKLDQAQWTRQISAFSNDPATWQWLKLFFDTVKGRWKSFLLRSYRPDLVAIGNASSGTLTVDGSQQSYVESWYPSTAHRRLAIVLADGSVNYRTVESTGGAGATEDLVLDSPLAGTIERVELLETVRLDSDEVSVTWGRGRAFRTDAKALVVQQ